VKRVIFSILGTVLGLVALLSFKSHGAHPTAAGGLPSAALPSTSSAPSTNPPPAGAPSSAASSTGPPHPASSAAAPVSRIVVGDSVDTRYGTVQIKVTLSGSTISQVSFVQLTAFDGRSEQINSDAAPILLQETLAAQSANIDTVSGATYTSQGYQQSLQSALDKAGRH
jgi:uncharacterized protein with FMN-binding domain